MISDIFLFLNDFIFPVIFIINILFAITVVFIERKNPTATIAWLMALFLLPIIGFILYLFVGQSFYRDRMFRVKKEDDETLTDIIESQKNELFSQDLTALTRISYQYKRMMYMLMESNKAPVTLCNSVRVFVDGNEKFKALLEAIRNAEDHIHLEYYILKDDEIGNEIFAALTERAKAGVTVRFLGDGLGAAGPRKSFFEPYLKAGGKLALFFPSLMNISHPRLNYRNHRKIAVIDGKTGFIGGFNIGDDYLSRVPEWAPWRDTAVQITGHAVLAMQIRFFLDWNYASKDDKIHYESRYYPEQIQPVSSQVPVQIVSGGPDTYWNPVKESYLKLISLATDSVYLQTPYFIPDESIMDALRIAALSGIDVRIMMPAKPDHWFVYWAGYSYIEQLLDAGVRAYTYDTGFIHAKTIVVDEVAASVGSANWDVRSFRLNFETNAIIYDHEVARELKQYFIEDLRVCTELTPERFAALPRKIKIKQSISRLFSPLL
ncbi:cardiolipin synthase [Methanospirillum stamsii]|uniref:Cardiolipin synthase n=1 Tax=Methanospirillum stamsii TaxID=1277351 RepID=A0A2V2N8C2_9EURY|nr:cardiolipin synthase [Methanospirillum stamsii]PWR76252.1 cardiolipin synthase [Methanospirillum stamsii]